MELLLQFAPHLAAMVTLMVFSAFFSSSEAALFSLPRRDHQRLAQRGPAQRLALKLLASPERLLTSVLFWNLVINIAYFALASVIGLALERQGHPGEAGLFAILALLALILLSEMIPKNLSVLWPEQIAGIVSWPLAAATRMIDPLLPTLQAIHRISLRTLLPEFQREPYLELRDIERAITLSTPDKVLARQEKRVLHQIVSLSEVEAEELMQPRPELTFYAPPVSLADLQAKPPSGDYLLVTEPDSDELARVLPLHQLPQVPTASHLESSCEPVPYVPWCASGADTLALLRTTTSGLVAVINEHGETMGIVTLRDVLQMIYTTPESRKHLHPSIAIQAAEKGGWQISGAITLRRLGKHLRITFPATKSVTVAGMLQEHLQRLPQPGDQVLFGQCRFEVTQSPRPGVLTAMVEPLAEESGEEPAASHSANGGNA